jgi:hypothetical protein
LKAQVFSHEKLIGTTELQIGDESMGHVYGEFLPTENYYKYIQKAVWEFWSSNKPDYVKWNSLQLNVQLDNGCFLFAAGGFTIDDLQELPEEAKRIDIACIDRFVIEDFILQQPPRPFVVAPWESISIEQKISFEEELRKELGNKGNSFLDFFKPKLDKHILMDFEIAAVCHDQRYDDVLFRTKKQGVEKEFAVVHLTWRGKQENTGYPKIEFFESYDEFKHLRMYPDKADWEY